MRKLRHDRLSSSRNQPAHRGPRQRWPKPTSLPSIPVARSSSRGATARHRNPHPATLTLESTAWLRSARRKLVPAQEALSRYADPKIENSKTEFVIAACPNLPSVRSQAMKLALSSCALSNRACLKLHPPAKKLLRFASTKLPALRSSLCLKITPPRFMPKRLEIG